MSLAVLKEQASYRWQEYEKLGKEYEDFEPFLIDCMEHLMGFVCTDIQIDIGKFLQHGPQYLMIQAQRSQAKSSIVAIYAVWCLIHDPKYRVLILSAGSDVALEIANWIIQIIMNWEILSCIRPDKTHGDRSSAKAFDIHWQLKGAEKSPSVACIGITANMQGRRADLLIADDIESSKNGLTEVQREALQHLSRDFTSICQHGRIAYLGTPQTTDSVYNNLPERGYTVRIWPGRYPTPEQMDNYGEHLAPLLAQRILDNPRLQSGGGPLQDQGQPTDPVLLPESALSKKELDQGTAYFQLQHMLNTRLMDSDRFPLKSGNLVTMKLNLEKGPGQVNWMPDKSRLLHIQGIPSNIPLYSPFSVSEDLYAYEGRLIYIDPAGGGANGDETVASVTYFLHGYIFLMEQLALPGGFDDSVFVDLSQLALRHDVNKIVVEENYGKGMFSQLWRPVLLNAYRDQGHSGAPMVEDIWEKGQKEFRILDTLEPVVARHRLIVNEDVWHKDVQQVQRYAVDHRTVYMLCHQLTKISRERHALVHDDRIDSLAGAVRPWLEMIATDEEVRMAQKQTDHAVEFMETWREGSPEFHSAKNKRVQQQANVLANSRMRNRTPTNRIRHAQAKRKVLRTSLSRRTRSTTGFLQ